MYPDWGYGCWSCAPGTLRAKRYCWPCRAAYQRAYRATHPLTGEARRKDIARSYAGVYYRRGWIKKGPCVDCGDVESQMHHEDYGKPFEVVWLCRRCHRGRHVTDEIADSA